MPRKPKPKQAPNFQPFADDAAVQTLGDFSVENGTTRIALHGSLDITCDREGLERARKLRTLVEAIVTALEARGLPEVATEETHAPKAVRNPFA